MPLAAPTRLGPYKALILLGAGGMGKVYRTPDTRLNREVALVMELVIGKSLCALVDHGPVPLRKTGDYAAQTAGGTAAAHTAVIIHCDLKPEDLMATPEGRIQTLDFGLARLEHAATAAATVGYQTWRFLADAFPGVQSPEPRSAHVLCRVYIPARWNSCSHQREATK